MSAKEFLEEAINQANKDIAILEESYWRMSPSAREETAEGWCLQELIEDLKNTVDNMVSALETFPEYIA